MSSMYIDASTSTSTSTAGPTGRSPTIQSQPGATFEIASQKDINSIDLMEEEDLAVFSDSNDGDDAENSADEEGDDAEEEVGVGKGEDVLPPHLAFLAGDVEEEDEEYSPDEETEAELKLEALAGAPKEPQQRVDVAMVLLQADLDQSGIDPERVRDDEEEEAQFSDDDEDVNMADNAYVPGAAAAFLLGDIVDDEDDDEDFDGDFDSHVKDDDDMLD